MQYYECLGYDRDTHELVRLSVEAESPQLAREKAAIYGLIHIQVRLA